jgi:hypothetical protein
MRYRTDEEQIDLATQVLWKELDRTHAEDHDPAVRQVWDYRPPHKTNEDQKRYYEARIRVERAAARRDALFYAINVLNDEDLDER